MTNKTKINKKFLSQNEVPSNITKLIVSPSTSNNNSIFSPMIFLKKHVALEKSSSQLSINSRKRNNFSLL